MQKFRFRVVFQTAGSVCNRKTKKKIISRSIEHQQESIKCNWLFSGANVHTKECHDCFDTVYKPKLSQLKIGTMIERKLLEIDMAVPRYGQANVLNRDNANYVKTNAWKPLFKKMKILH